LEVLLENPKEDRFRRYQRRFFPFGILIILFIYMLIHAIGKADHQYFIYLAVIGLAISLACFFAKGEFGK